MTMPGTFTIASVGDLLIRRPASQSADEGVRAALQLIRDADLAVGNLEVTLIDMRSVSGGGPMNKPIGETLVQWGTHEVAADLKTMGFDMVNRANNHVLDTESDGLFATNALLDEAGIVHAGTGRNLDEAAAPAFLELPQGRVGLVGMHTPWNIADRRLAATHREGNLGGRPGVNMLNYSDAIVLTPEHLASLRQIRDEMLEYNQD